MLQDILIGIRNINTYLGNQRNFIAYDSNNFLQDAIERNLITIGEAINAILKINPLIHITNSRKIVDTRNKLTHGYDEIDSTQIWNIIINHLPQLESEVIALINS